MLSVAISSFDDELVPLVDNFHTPVNEESYRVWALGNQLVGRVYFLLSNKD